MPVSHSNNQAGVFLVNWFNDQWYVIAGVFDANGFAEDNLEFFSGGGELFSQVELGWAPSQAERLNRKINISLWHKDERVDAGKDSGQGILFTTGWTFGSWITFFRAGYSEGEASAFNQTITAGFQYNFIDTSDQLGLGINWGNPSNKSLPSQISTEFYYRFQLSQNLAITPNVQWISNPALNSQTDQVWIFGLRTRFTF